MIRAEIKTLPCWLRRAMRNRHRHAIELASRRWRTRRKTLISTQVPPLTLVNYIVDASGLTELNFPSIDLPVIGTVGGWAFLNSFPQYTPPADLSIVTAVSQFSTPGNALLGAVGN